MTFDSPAGLEILPQASAGPSGYTPQQIRHAYGLDNIVQNGVTLDGTGQTIAIVVAYDAPTIASDLQQFSAAFGLPAANLTIVKQNVNGTLPAANATWAKETSLDVQWVHAIAPGANILLVEAIDAGVNLYTQAAWAAQQPGVSVVSMSFASFVSYSTGYDSAFVTPSGHQGVTFVAASGDRGNSGYPSNSSYSMYPADSPNVVGVGSTSLVMDASGNYVSESATSYSGGGYSLYEPMPSYQANAGITTPGNMKGNPDVSFVGGDGSKAIPIYNAYAYGASTPWGAVQGTSASAPMFAGLIALANQGRALAGKATLDGPSQTLPLLYQFQTSFHDITQGGNAAYQAGTGYDFVTGLGTPIGDILVPQLVQGGFLPLAAQGSFAISASAGAAFSNQELATFSDPNGNLATGAYSAVINWGDGTSTTSGTIAVDGQGNLAVFGGHAYATAGNFTITVTITSGRTGAPAGTSVQSSANVTSGSVAPLSGTGGFTINATKGVAFSNQELATFSDPNGALATSAYSAVINWGDGTATSSGVIAVDGQGKLAVFGGHTYANTGNFTITVTISSSRAGAPAGTSVQSTATVAAPVVLPLSGTGGFTVNATKGVAFSNQELATFSDPNGALATSSYSAVINWGDGTATTSGVIAVDSQSKLAVFGGHTYANTGNFTITVTISSSRAGAPAGTSVQSTATVAAPVVLPISGTGGFTVNATKGAAFSNQELATFSDPNGALATSSYSAVINWGDGTATTSGVIAVDSQSKLAVFGGHTYANAGNFTITVTISSSRAGAPAGTSVQSTATVAAPVVLPLSGTGGFTVNATKGVAISNQELATFNDPNGALATSSYSAVINWGDGTATTSGVIAVDSQSKLAVFGGHTYANAGNFTITVTISSSRAGAPAGTSVQSTASVTAPTIQPLSANGGFTLHATKGAAFSNQELATFSDPNGALATSSYSAVINWGDGTATTSGVIAVDSQSKLAVFGGHTYANTGNFTITVTISSSRAGAPAGTSVQSTTSVTAPTIQPLSANGGFTLHATKGAAFSNQELATFNDPNGALATNSYSAVVNWGDGTGTTSGVIAIDGQGRLAVFGSHVYSAAGNFTITVTISSSRVGAPAGTSVQSAASVTASGVSPLVANGGYVMNVGIGTALINQKVATFSDPNGALPTSAYSASVNWGDGVSTDGVIATDLQGRLAVFGNHTYAAKGAFTVTVTIASARSGAPAATSVYSTASMSALPANLTPTEYYVSAVYQVLLGRSPATAERQATAQQLNAGVSRTSFVNAIDHSDEYFHTLIAANYLKYLGRAVDVAGQDYWTSQMKAGLTDESLEAMFVASAEYYAHCGGTDLDWVNHMYLDILGRSADPAGQANWIRYLAAGGSRRQVAFGFAISPERESQHIQQNYQQYLGRSADSAGLQYWLNGFLQGKTNEDLITGFLASDEYFRTHSSQS